MTLLELCEANDIDPNKDYDELILVVGHTPPNTSTPLADFAADGRSRELVLALLEQANHTLRPH